MQSDERSGERAVGSFILSSLRFPLQIQPVGVFPSSVVFFSVLFAAANETLVFSAEFHSTLTPEA